MLDLAAAGAAEGLWLRAECQRDGRGRQGRTWVSTTGNLYASTLVRLRPTDPPAATLALVSAVALEEALRVFMSGGKATIKWPNDLLIDGGKVAGILLERAGDAVVVGLGVNCAHHPALDDRATTSLSEHGILIDPGVLVETLADIFARWIGLWRGQGVAPVRARWLERAHPIGTALTARLSDGSAIDGLFAGLDPDGALRLRLADGSERVVHAADVFLL